MTTYICQVIILQIGRGDDSFVCTYVWPGWKMQIVHEGKTEVEPIYRTIEGKDHREGSTLQLDERGNKILKYQKLHLRIGLYLPLPFPAVWKYQLS